MPPIYNTQLISIVWSNYQHSNVNKFVAKRRPAVNTQANAAYNTLFTAVTSLGESVCSFVLFQISRFNLEPAPWFTVASLIGPVVQSQLGTIQLYSVYAWRLQFLDAPHLIRRHWRGSICKKESHQMPRSMFVVMDFTMKLATNAFLKGKGTSHWKAGGRMLQPITPRNGWFCLPLISCLTLN